MLGPPIVILRPPNFLDQIIICSISAQLRYFSEPLVRRRFTHLEEGLVDTLAELFEEVEDLDLLRAWDLNLRLLFLILFSWEVRL